MKAEDFKEMPLDEKTNYLWDRGHCIHQETIEDGCSLCIFEVNDFYVEAIFSKHQILKIRTMIEVSRFEQYVDNVIQASLNSN